MKIALSNREDKLKTKRLTTSIVSFFGQFLLLGILILIPLIYTEALPKTQLMTFLVAPPPPPPPPPPPAAVVKVVKIQSDLVNGQLRTPTKIPEKVQMIKEEEAPPAMAGGVMGGVPGGVPGGSMGGVIGGMINSTPVTFPRSRHRNGFGYRHGVSQGLLIKQSSAELSASGTTGSDSGNGGSAGRNQQGRHDPEPAIDQRTPHAGTGCD